MHTTIGFVIVLGSVVLLAGKPSQDSLTDAQRADIEKAVAEAHAGILRSAEQLDLDKAIGVIPENDKGAFIQDGQTFNARFAETVVFVLKDNEWKVLHAHQSYPNGR